MKTRFWLMAVGLTIGTLSAPTFLQAAKGADAEQEQTAEEKEGKKNTTVLTLAASPEKVHAAALEALAAIGCKVKKNTADYIEGKRSNKVGLAVGSGGEKLLVWIKASGEGKTELKVVTKKTMVGIVGQKLWNEEVAAQIRDAVE